MQPMTLLVAALAAASVLLVFWALVWARGGDVNERLERYAASGQPAAAADKDKAKKDGAGLRQALAGSKAFKDFNRVVERRDFAANLARELARADLTLKPSEFLALRAASIVGLPVITWLVGATLLPSLGNPLAWIVAGVVGWWLPGFWLKQRKGKRLKAFNRALADTITLIANALRSGSSFLQAIEMVVRETQPPISSEFNRVIREVNLGLPFDQALNNMARRVRSDDLELMVTAISIQHQVGGNLAEILDSIAFTIRERVRIKGEIKTLTAQQRMSGYVVGFLPIGLVGILMVIAPKFMEPMFMKPPEVFGLPLGVVILAFGGFMMLMGFMFIRRIVDIEV
jgi:tight adherence protein B